jgi:hypothetical protein
MPRDETYEGLRVALTQLVTSIVREVENRQRQAAAEGIPVPLDEFEVSLESGPVGMQIHNLSLWLSDTSAIRRLGSR